MEDEINPTTGKPWVGPRRRDVPDASGQAPEGERDAPAGVSDDEEPPEPAFLVAKGKFGPGVDGVYFPDGTPVGVWLAQKHPRWRAEHVLQQLLDRGLDAEHAEQFARRRAGRDRDTETLAALIGSESMWAEFVRLEGERAKRLEPLRAAFIAAQKKKQ